jgi:citrate lyase beta subunit
MPTADRLIRSLLFVPASKPALAGKAARSAADAVCLDLEDGVAPAEKDAARTTAVDLLRSVEFGPRVRIVRINGADTPFAYRDLVELVEGAGAQIDLVMLPKVESAFDVAFADRLLTQIEARTGLSRRIGLEAQIESAAGFLNAGAIAAASSRLEALVFGAGDYAASMGMPSIGIGVRDAHDEAYPGHRWHAVMHAIVAAARAHGLRCLDGPHAAYGDLDGLRAACRLARTLGFDGKQCIHPAQLDPVNQAFSPTTDEVAWAEAVVAACDRAEQGGQGAAAHEGRMIDAATRRMAQGVLLRHERVRVRHLIPDPPGGEPR